MLTNTAKYDRHEDWVMGGNPRAIEEQEEKGRNELLNSEELPRKMFVQRGGKYIDAKKQYEKLGMKVEDKSDDELFYKVVLPDGWKIERTDHTMWTQLVNKNGKKVAMIFYKAAFYDRRAAIHFEK